VIRKAILAASLLFAVPAFAQTPQQQPLPPTFELPSGDVVAMLNYFGDRPSKEVYGFVGVINACAGLVMPSATPIPPGQCKSVADAMAARSSETAALKAQVAELTKQLADAKAAH